MSDKKTILLVDDDATFLETTKIALEQHYNIRTAPDGKTCLEEVKNEKPDLIILDVMMRHLGEGLDVAKELKNGEETKDIPVIMLTGVSEQFDLSTQTDDSFYPRDAWLEKPVEPAKLLSEVKKHLNE